MQSVCWTASGACVAAVTTEGCVLAPGHAEEPMTHKRREIIPSLHRLRTQDEFAAVKQAGIALRGRHFVLLGLSRPGHPSKVGFIASRKSVGGAVQRNRARRRLREIVRRRWPAVPPEGQWLLFIASRRVLTASHTELVADVERAMAGAGALPPAGEAG